MNLGFTKLFVFFLGWTISTWGCFRIETIWVSFPNYGLFLIKFSFPLPNICFIYQLFILILLRMLSLIKISIWMRIVSLCTELIRTIRVFCIVYVWPGGWPSPVRIIAQVQWFMYQNQSEPSGGIYHLHKRNWLLWLRVNLTSFECLA